MSSLLSSISKEIRETMDIAEEKSSYKALENAEDFYSEGNPIVYERTGKYGDAPDSTGVIGNGKHYEFDIFMNPSGHGYTTGTFSAQEVWQAIENHTAGVLGKSGRWEQTKNDIEKIVKQEFSKKFK